MRFIKILAAAAALAASSTASAAVLVSAQATTPTLIGTYGPGTYNFATTGVVSLQGPLGSGFDLNADGVPLPPSVTDPTYSEQFNPNGTDDINGTFGPAGPGINFGSLAGTYSADGSTGYFEFGTSETLTFAATTSLYGLVNDTFPSNNDGAFSVSAAAVPEPATWALMLVGFGFVGGVMRSAKRGRRLSVFYV